MVGVAGWGELPVAMLLIAAVPTPFGTAAAAVFTLAVRAGLWCRAATPAATMQSWGGAVVVAESMG